jgi:hypothetical protein
MTTHRLHVALQTLTMTMMAALVEKEIVSLKDSNDFEQISVRLIGNVERPNHHERTERLMKRPPFWLPCRSMC